MSLKNVLAKLEVLNGTASTNDKVELLKGYLENKLFLKTVIYALHGLYHYNIKQFPPKAKNTFLQSPDSKAHPLKLVFDQLDYLRGATGANDTDKYQLYKFCEVIDEETIEVVRRIVNKDLRCGVSAKLINRALPNTLLIMPYMRCHTEQKIDNIVFDNNPEQSLADIIIQEKADSMFCNVLINGNGKIRFLTRNGKTVRQLTSLKKKMTDRPPVKRYGTRRGIKNSTVNEFYSMTFQGEMMVMKKGKLLSRGTGNGILNQCIQGTASPEDAKCVVIRLWDSVPLGDFWKGIYNRTYSDRLFKTRQFVSCIGDKKAVDLVLTKYVHTLEEAQDFYSKIRLAGGEGAILKDRKTIWKSHTSPTQVKMKNVIDVELILTGWYHGKVGKKYEHCIGGLMAKSACGEIEVNLGTGIGLSDDFRGYHPIKDKITMKIIDPMVIDMDLAEEACEDVEMQEGAIIQCECESVSKSKTKKKHSLFLPRFIDYRFDKDEADTLKDILER